MPNEEGFLGAIGRIASSFVAGQPNAHQFVWQAIAPWVTELSRAATEHWLPVLVQGIPCEVIDRLPDGMGVRCAQKCIAACGVCRNACCLDHSFVSKRGATICYGCAERAHAAFNPKAAPPPPPPPPPPGRAPNEARRSRSSQGHTKSEPPPKNPEPHQNRATLADARRILGITKRSPTLAEVQAAYRKLAGKYHPDVIRTGDQGKFITIGRARAVLVKAIEEGTL